MSGAACASSRGVSSQDVDSPLVELGQALRAERYEFVTPSPATHRRVDARAAASGRGASSLRDVFGWSRSFAPAALPRRILDLALAADVLVREGDRYRSRIRFATLADRIFAHSAFPTTAPDAVFFGPDTYRFCALVERELRGRRARRAIDVGCGAGAGGIVASPSAVGVVLADVNPDALALARVNARLANVHATVLRSDVLESIDGPFDVVLANPPYMADPARRGYRDGGGSIGEGLSVRIVRASLERLAPGGRLVLYTGAAIVDGRDAFLEAPSSRRRASKALAR